MSLILPLRPPFFLETADALQRVFGLHQFVEEEVADPVQSFLKIQTEMFLYGTLVEAHDQRA